MPDEVLADIMQAEAIEARRLAIAFLFEKPEPCVGDIDRLKHFNMAALEIVDITRTRRKLPCLNTSG